MATQAEDAPKAAGADESSSSAATSSSDAASVKDMKKVMMDTKVEGGKSAWAMTLETFGMSDGKKKKDDIICESFDEAFTVFQEMTTDKNWEFATTPFEDFNATHDDLLRAFVHWSRKGEDGETNYNPSKALRRLEAYVEWMNKNCANMNLNGDSSMKEVHNAWKMKVTHDKDGRLIWWIDFSSLDLKIIKSTINNDDVLRYFVWLSHLVLFDKGSQEHGFVFVESIGKTGFIEMMTCVSMDVGTKLDRLTIGTLPVKMEACILLNNPTWMRVLMGLLSPFLGKKMRKRIKIIPNKSNPQVFFEENNIGKGNIPTGILHLEGTVEKDRIEEALERVCNK